MSDEVDDGVEEFKRRRARGGRVKQIRDALELTGGQFAERLMEVAAHLEHGGAIQLDKTIVSNIERGKRELSVEEVAAIVEVDPHRRSAQWLVFGQETIRSRLAKAIGPGMSDQDVLALLAELSGEIKVTQPARRKR